MEKNTNRLNENTSSIQLDYLLKEYDVLKDLYIQAVTDTQSIFNYYLAFVTAASGGIVFLLQNWQALPNMSLEKLVSGFLFFIFIVGVITTSTISDRYGNMARYGQTIDEIRRFLIRRHKIDLPILYSRFLDKSINEPTLVKYIIHKRLLWLTWLLPIGAYQTFIALVNSICLSISTWLIWKDLSLTVILGCISFIGSNMISRKIRDHFVNILGMSIDYHR